ncbi:MAG: hypothetical protein EA398_05820 [Deltaproteobacteria bacterium]|nr:MAG: hypothetical protein EA398_05820 [Deltaproteobacteria bacterium]
MDVVVIANPRAGSGRGEALARSLQRRLPADVRVLRTATAGEGAALARAAVGEGARELVSIGGDGTHSEVVEGILSAGVPPGEVTLRPLHAGTGGDFRRLLDAFDPEDTPFEHWVSGNAPLIDAGLLEWTDEEGRPARRHFLNMVTFGLGGLVDRYVNRGSKRLGGRTSFFLATVRALAGWKPSPVRIVADGVDRGTWTVTNVIVGNGRHCGGGMCLAPEALLDDGLFEVLILPDVPLFRSARLAPRLYDGSIHRQEGVTAFRAREIEAIPLDEQRPAWLDVDGEDLGRIPCRLSVIPSAIRLRTPRRDVLRAGPEHDGREEAP